MKCKICGFDIVEGQTACPGCGTNVETLKQAGNVVFEQPEESVEQTQVVESSIEPVEEAPVAEPIVEATPVEEAPVAEPIVEATPVEEAPVAEHVVEATPVEEAPVAEPIVEATPVEEAPVAEPVVEPTPVVETSAEHVVEPTPAAPTSSIDNPQAPSIEDTTTMASLDDGKTVKEPKKKSKVLPVLLIVILLIVLVAGGIAAYFHFIYGSPVNVFSRAIDDVKTSINNEMGTDNVNSTTATMGFNYSGTQGLDFLNNLDLTVNTQMDKTTGNNVTSMKINYNESTMDINAVIQDAKGYFYIPSLFDSYLVTDLVTEDITDDSIYDYYERIVSHSEELNRLSSSFTSSLSASLSNDNFAKTYEKTTINGEEKTVAKVTMTLNKETLKTLVINTLTNIKNDDQAVTDLSVLLNISTQEVKERIDTFLADLVIEIDNLEVTLYTDLTTTKLYEAVITETIGTVETVITYDKDGDEFTLTLTNTEVQLSVDTNNKRIIANVTQDGETIGFTINYNVSSLPTITYPDLSTAVDTNTLTDEQQMEIGNKLMQNELIVNLLSAVINIPSDTPADDTLIDDTTVDETIIGEATTEPTTDVTIEDSSLDETGM